MLARAELVAFLATADPPRADRDGNVLPVTQL
jgi:hypothetical protein